VLPNNLTTGTFLLFLLPNTSRLALIHACLLSLAAEVSLFQLNLGAIASDFRIGSLGDEIWTDQLLPLRDPKADVACRVKTGQMKSIGRTTGL